MARDETARDSPSEQTLLERRSHLWLAGATAATVARSDETPSGEAISDDASSVPADETHHTLLEDDFREDDAAAMEVRDGS